MTYNPDIHHRRSIRLREYDYSSTGAYFVTICVHGRECLLGDISKGEMHLNDAGRMVAEWWMKLPGKFPVVALDEYVIMPNHFHGIVSIVGAPPRGCPLLPPRGCPPLPPGGRPESTSKTGQPHWDCPYMIGSKPGRPHGAAPTGHQSNRATHLSTTLGDVMDWFKTMTTNAYIKGVKQADWPPFPGRLWQRNYYERIIRDDAELSAVREYILFNPANWAVDEEYHP